MLNYTQCKLVIRCGEAAGAGIYNDLATIERESLAPNNYDGDGESFAFDWTETLKHQIPAEEEDQARQIYLAAHWQEIERLQWDITAACTVA